MRFSNSVARLLTPPSLLADLEPWYRRKVTVLRARRCQKSQWIRSCMGQACSKSPLSLQVCWCNAWRKALAMIVVQRCSGAVKFIPGTAFSKEGSTVSVQPHQYQQLHLERLWRSLPLSRKMAWCVFITRTSKACNKCRQYFRLHPYHLKNAEDLFRKTRKYGSFLD